MGRIIENHVQVASAIAAIQHPQKAEKLHRGVAVVTGADDLA
jgi:hypothetical protein